MGRESRHSGFSARTLIVALCVRSNNALVLARSVQSFINIHTNELPASSVDQTS